MRSKSSWKNSEHEDLLDCRGWLKCLGKYTRAIIFFFRLTRCAWMQSSSQRCEASTESVCNIERLFRKRSETVKIYWMLNTFESGTEEQWQLRKKSKSDFRKKITVYSVFAGKYERKLLAWRVFMAQTEHPPEWTFFETWLWNDTMVF